MKACIIEIKISMLEHFLQIPPGARIRRVNNPIDRNGILQFHVEGIGNDVGDGAFMETRFLVVYQKDVEPDPKGFQSMRFEWPNGRSPAGGNA